MELISIIIPVYKTKEYLPKCIESIFSQTYTNLEIILVDDGSPDDSGQICDEYAQKDSRVIVIHKENGGVSSARNAALDIAKGSYILFVDSDDSIEPNMCEVLYKNITENNAEMACCNMKSIFPEKTRLWYNNDADIVFNAEEAGYELCRCMYMNPGIACKLLKTETVKNLRMREKIFIGEDTLFIYESIQNMNRIHYTSLPLYNCFIREGSAYNSGFNHKLFTEQTAFKIILEIAEKNMPDNIPAIKCHITNTILGMAHRVWKDPERSKKMRNRYLKIFQRNVRKNFNIFDMIRIKGGIIGIKCSIQAISLSCSILMFKAFMNVYYSIYRSVKYGK